MTSVVPITKPKSAKDGAENALSLALLPAGAKRPNGSLLVDA